MQISLHFTPCSLPKSMSTGPKAGFELLQNGQSMSYRFQDVFETPKNVQGSSKKAPESRQGAANSLENSVRVSKTSLRRLEDYPRRLQDTLRWLQDASKSLDRRPQAPQDASTSPTNLLKSAYHIASKMFYNEGYLDN